MTTTEADSHEFTRHRRATDPSAAARVFIAVLKGVVRVARAIADEVVYTLREDSYHSRIRRDDDDNL